MSNNEKVDQTVGTAKEKLANLTAFLLDLKENKPKVFFGGVAGVVILLLIIMFSGGESSNKPKIGGNVLKSITVGQKYTLKSANAIDPGATVRLVSTPGSIAAYDDTEEADRNGACQHMPQGTPVSALELQDAFGKPGTYVKVQIEDGECKGTAMWALAIDLQ